MEPMTSWTRPPGTTSHCGIRGLGMAGLVCAVLAGCGTAAAATTPAAAPPAPAAGGVPLAVAAAQETGCASVNQATSVTVVRHVIVTEPINGGTRTYTQSHATLVRALFGDFCTALAHAGIPQSATACSARGGGIAYAGTFYDGQRTLATFIYSLRGCARLSMTASGKTRGSFLIGKAAAAAPHLKADLAAVLGVPQAQV
jgi:hypothetical protein